MGTAHVDTFARDNLPPREQQPEYLFDLPELAFPAQLNCATELLDRRVAEGGGDAPCIRTPEGTCWTYADLLAKANRIANVLQREMGVVPGNRVLLRAPNNPMMAACWFAVMKAGAIAVATMPLLRAKELATIIDKAKVSHALCDARLADELRAAVAQSPSLRVKLFDDTSGEGLEAAMARQPDAFRQRRHGRGRHLHPRLHLGNDGRAQGDDALSSRRDGDLQVLSAARPACAARRRLLRQSAARVHLRPRRAPAVSDEHRRVDAARRKAVARRAARRHPLAWRHGDLHRADVVSRAGRAWRGRPREQAPQVRIRGRSVAGDDARAVEGGDRHRHHRRHRVHRAPAHLHLRRRGARAPRRDGQGDTRATLRVSSTTRAVRSRPTPSDGSP